MGEAARLAREGKKKDGNKRTIEVNGRTIVNGTLHVHVLWPVLTHVLIRCRHTVERKERERETISPRHTTTSHMLCLCLCLLSMKLHLKMYLTKICIFEYSYLCIFVFVW